MNFKDSCQVCENGGTLRQTVVYESPTLGLTLVTDPAVPLDQFLLRQTSWSVENGRVVHTTRVFLPPSA